MSNKSNYLITGATRGIGGHIVSQLLSSRPDVHIIAGVRDLDASSAKALASNDNVTVVEIDSNRNDTPFQAAKELQAQGITSIDRVYANAGIGAETQVGVDKTSTDEMQNMFQVNTLAPLLLFQAFKPFLLQASQQNPGVPQFIVTSSLLASLTMQAELPYQVTPYSVSKVAVNMVVQRIAVEEPWLTAYVVHPGLVATDMALQIVDKDALGELVQQGTAIRPEDSASKFIALTDSAKHKTHSGHFFDVQAGKEVPN